MNIAKIMTDCRKNIYRVLIVSDDTSVSELLNELLAGPGRSVEVRDSSQAALEFLEHNPIDAAFLVSSRGLTSTKLAEKIKQRGPHVQILTCDGLVGENRAENARVTRLPRATDKQFTFGESLRLADSYKTE